MTGKTTGTPRKEPIKMLKMFTRVAGLAVAAAAASALLAPSAYATDAPPNVGGGAAPVAHHLGRAMVVSVGLPAWQVTVIAIGSALLGVVATIMTLRSRTRRRPLSLRTS